MHAFFRSLAFALAAAAASEAQSYVNFEAGPTAALRLSPDGTRLFVADTVGHRLCVFDLRDPSAPFLLAEIPVGLAPVAVQARNRDEVWVACQLSDCVSVVDVRERAVIASIATGDEPSDIVFAGNRAFVTAATRDEVQVFDVATRAPVGSVAVFGKDPRALATSPDGSRVYAVVERSGNGTTILPSGVQAPPPVAAGLPPAPAQGILVRADDPSWAAQIPYSLPDNDIAEIDAATLTVNRYFRGVGTTNTGIAVHAGTGQLWVANIEARNLVRFEPALRGHAIDSRLTRITPTAVPSQVAFDLNPGIDYSVLPNPAGLAVALAEPFGVAIDATAGLVYVAAHGTDRIGVLDLSGNIVARIEVGGTPGAAVDTRRKRGPRALALHPSVPRLYVLNRLSDTLAVVDTGSRTVLQELEIATVDLMPAAMRQGRKFLYDSKLSGNGTMSCAACHIDGDIDGIAWDLGDPNGTMQAAPAQLFPFNLGLQPFHPAKGPTTTQTLRGLAGTGLLHWRGDRADFQAFNAAFATLLGGSPLAAQDMADYAAFALAIVHPPNPNQQKGRAYRTAPAGNNEAAGLVAFNQNISSFPIPGGASCSTCHPLPTGTNGRVIAASALQSPQQMKAPQLRNAYRKLGFRRQAGPQKSGFGYTHDGAIDSLATFLNQPQFNPWPVATKDDIATLLLSLDTGMAPAIGMQRVLDQSSAASPALAADLALLTARAAAGDLDLIAHGRVDGEWLGLLYRAASSDFVADRTGVGPFPQAQLLQRAAAGNAVLAFTAVPPGSGNILALDRDGDTTANGDEDADPFGAPTPGCAGASVLRGNSEPRIGNGRFGHAIAAAPASSLGLFALALAPASLPAIGITVLVDPASAVVLTLASDGSGGAIQPFPIPAAAAFVGLSIYAQALWLDACGSQSWSSSQGLRYAIRP